jgi:aminopeptidase N
MEHQTAIAYGNGFKNFKGLPMDYIIVHETAHEWWGNAISVDDYADVFIHEGFAMYSEFLYVERKFGQDTAQMYADMWQRTISNIRPVVGPRDVNFWDYHDIDPYVKGAWCLKGLRYLLDNDTLFFDIVKSYYQSRKYTVVTVKDFTDFVNEKTGKDYLWYFNHYLYRAEAPTLELAVIPTKKLHKYKYPIKNMSSDTGGQLGNEVLYLYCRWTNVEDNFVMPVVVSNPSQPKETKILPITTEGGIFVLDNKVWSLNQDFYFDMKQLKKVKTK